MSEATQAPPVAQVRATDMPLTTVEDLERIRLILGVDLLVTEATPETTTVVLTHDQLTALADAIEAKSTCDGAHW